MSYGPDERIFPSLSDEDLWNSVFDLLKQAYGERVLPGHARKAFVAVCDENANFMLFRDFYRNVRVHWLWKRPPLPRGIESFD